MSDFKWKIIDLNAYNDQGLIGIVHSIQYSCENVNNGNVFEGSAILSYPTGSLTPLSDITKDVAEGWLFDSLGEGKAMIENDLNTTIDTETGVMPTWLNAGELNGIN